MQRLLRAPEHTVEVVDLRGASDPDTAALTWMRAAMAKAGGSDAGPLFLAAVLRVTDDRSLVFHRVHHIALDGAGMALFAERVAEIYSCLYDGRAVPESGWAGSVPWYTPRPPTGTPANAPRTGTGGWSDWPGGRTS